VGVVTELDRLTLNKSGNVDSQSNNQSNLSSSISTR
jgi:hypothetical protein